MATISPELRREIEKAGDQPVRIEDPQTSTAYVIVKAEVYERLQALVAGPLSIGEQRAMLRHVGERAGWDDQAMDVYNDLDPRR
jgi:hypothetical protein